MWLEPKGFLCGDYGCWGGTGYRYITLRRMNGLRGESLELDMASLDPNAMADWMTNRYYYTARQER